MLLDFPSRRVQIPFTLTALFILLTFQEQKENIFGVTGNATSTVFWGLLGARAYVMPPGQRAVPVTAGDQRPTWTGFLGQSLYTQAPVPRVRVGTPRRKTSVGNIIHQ